MIVEMIFGYVEELEWNVFLYILNELYEVWV